MEKKQAKKEGRVQRTAVPFSTRAKKGASEPGIGIGASAAPIDPAFEESAGRVKEHLAKEFKKRKK